MQLCEENDATFVLNISVVADDVAEGPRLNCTSRVQLQSSLVEISFRWMCKEEPVPLQSRSDRIRNSSRPGPLQCPRKGWFAFRLPSFRWTNCAPTCRDQGQSRQTQRSETWAASLRFRWRSWRWGCGQGGRLLWQTRWRWRRQLGHHTRCWLPKEQVVRCCQSAPASHFIMQKMSKIGERKRKGW